MDKKELTSSFMQKHGLPSNSANLEMASRLTSLLKGTDELTSRGQSCSINGLGETASEREAIDEICKFKKVRFNPDIEVRHYAVSVKRRGRRRSMVKKPAQENPVKLLEENVHNTRRLTRSRAQNAVDGEANKILASVGKRGRKGIKGGYEVKNCVHRDKLGPHALELCSDVVEYGDTSLSRRKLRNGEVENANSGDEGGEDVVVSRKNTPCRSSRERVNAKGGEEVLLLNSASEGNNIAYRDAKLGVFNEDPCGVEAEIKDIEVHTKVLQLKKPTNISMGQKFARHKKEAGNEIHAKEDDVPGKGLRRSKRKLGKSADSKVLLTEEAKEVEVITARLNSKFVNEICGLQEERGDIVQDEKSLNCQGTNTNRQKPYVLQKHKRKNDGLQVKKGTREQSQYTDLDDKSSELEAVGEVSNGNDEICLPSDLPKKV